jgi:hypothetical protein
LTTLCKLIKPAAGTHDLYVDVAVSKTCIFEYQDIYMLTLKIFSKLKARACLYIRPTHKSPCVRLHCASAPPFSLSSQPELSVLSCQAARRRELDALLSSGLAKVTWSTGLTGVSPKPVDKGRACPPGLDQIIEGAFTIDRSATADCLHPTWTEGGECAIVPSHGFVGRESPSTGLCMALLKPVDSGRAY